MKNKARTIINRLLEFKSKEYKEKYFILSKIAETNIQLSENNFNEYKCYVKSLNESDGKFPKDEALYSLYENQISIEKNAKKAKSYKDNLVREVSLFCNYNKNSVGSVIDNILENASIKNKKLDKKLEETLYQCCTLDISLINEASYEGKNIVDLTKFFDNADDDKEAMSRSLAAISAEDDEFDMEDDVEDSSSSAETEMTVSKGLSAIENVFKPVIGGKDPKKMSKQAIANLLGFKGNGKYKVGQSVPVISAWDSLEFNMLRKMSPYGRSKGLSTLAQRKWWIFETIKFCLMVEKQSNFFLGLSDSEKSNFSRIKLDKDQQSAVQSAMGSTRSPVQFGRSLSDSEISSIVNDVQAELQKGNYDLESQSISEQRLLRLLARASSARKETIDHYRSALEMMYPIKDNRPDFAKAKPLSDKDRQDTQDEVESFFKKKEQESKDVYGDEIDPETGEPLYADEEQIQKINKQKSEAKKTIEKQEIIRNMSKSNYFNMTSREAVEYLEELDKSLIRLGELYDKSVDKLNPEIFSVIQKDSQGNILPDINAIPDVISAEGLTDEEQQEMEKIIEKLAAVDVVKMINDCEREQIYQELVDKSVTVDEFISYNKRFGLNKADKPMTWEDIKRASAGEFTGSAGARQYGVKAWIKSVFFNFSPSDKAEIYSFLAEKWYDRLKTLDLIDDQAFAVKTDKVYPNDPSKDKAIPRKALDAAEAMGKYKRSSKLVDISNMLELVSKYTSPRYVKRYFDEKRDDNLPQSVSEKLYQIQTFAETADEYDTLVRRLEAEDPDTMAFAIMESMFNSNSGFRYYATGLKKEYYNTIIWPQTEISLAQAVKDYFKRYYPSAGIAKSLASNEGSDAVKPEEGKDLFNKLIYVAMERTGIKTSGKGVPNVGDSVEERKEYLRGNLDSRGDFEKAVAAYNTKYQQGKNSLKGSDGGVFSSNDVENIIDDMFSSSGIIGKASSNLKRLSTTTVGEFISWVESYPEAKLDQAIVLGMSLSDFYRREDVDAILTLPIQEIGKDTAKALKDYKKKYGKSQLMSSDFVEWLDDYLGMEPVDLTSKGAKNPAGKSFQ